MKLNIVLVLTFLSSGLFCQTMGCGNDEIQDQFFKNNPDYISKKNSINEFTNTWTLNNLSQADLSVNTVSVVVHVLFRDSVDNISDNQIYSGLEVLNEDFRKLNSDFINTPVEFQLIAADCEIEFCLAPIDEYGNTTSGITRTQIPDSFDVFSSYFNPSFGGKEPWDNLRYLNVWILDLSSLGDGIGGFGQPPSAIGEAFDGVVVDYRYWGRIEQAITNPPFDLGRTATHEVGHYLNLDHPWGLEIGCHEGDFVDDTAPQFGPLFGCPTFPKYDSCTLSGIGLAFPNYMDYTLPACKTMFTLGQKDRMRATLAGPRFSLIEDGVCEQMSEISSTKIESLVRVFPNPTQDYLYIETRETEVLGELTIMDMSSRLIFNKKNINSNTIELNMADWLRGVFVIQLLNSDGKILLIQKLLIY